MTLADPYWCAKLSEFASDKDSSYGSMIFFLAAVDEFQRASSAKVRASLARRIDKQFICDSSQDIFSQVDGVSRMRKQLACDFVELGAEGLPLSFYASMYGRVLSFCEEAFFQSWLESCARSPALNPRASPRTQQRSAPGAMVSSSITGRHHEISAPALLVDGQNPSSKFTLAQQSAGVRSLAPPVVDRKVHRRSLSVDSGSRPISPAAAYHHQGIENLSGDEKWRIESPLSDECTFNWDLLNTSNTDASIETIKCLVLGDMDVGKTQLCKCMLGDEFDAKSAPTVFETYKIRVPLWKQIPVELWDMSGNSKYDRKRPVVYPNVNSFLLCFDLTRIESWTNLCTKWIPEIMSESTRAVVIVGCKYDAINSSNAHATVQPSVVQKYIDKKMIGNFKCVKFLTCSAANCAGLEEVFQAIVYSTLYSVRRSDEINTTVAKLRALKHLKL